MDPLSAFAIWGKNAPFLATPPKYYYRALVVPVRSKTGLVAGRRGIYAHHDAGIAAVIRDGQARFGARFLCGGYSLNAGILPNADAYGGVCAVCADAKLGPGVYYFSNAAGRVIYIGSSERPLKRQQQHPSSVSVVAGSGQCAGHPIPHDLRGKRRRTHRHRRREAASQQATQRTTPQEGGGMTAPYFSDDLVTLFLGDCREVTEWLAADVLVTDPPYGRGAAGIDSSNRTVGRTYCQTNKDAPIIGDEDTGLRDAALARWGKRPAVIFGDLRIPSPEGTGHVAVYRKPTDAGYRSTAGFRRDVEGIFLLNLPAGYGGRSSVIESGARMVGGSVGPAGRYGHPHAKPVDVMETLISVCPPGVIADPFAGSGSTLVAARNLGRKVIGIELEERYCERAALRLSQSVLEFGGVA